MILEQPAPLGALQAGTGTGRYKPGGILLRNLTSQATLGTSEETLASVTIPANTLVAAGQTLRVTAIFSTAANTNAKVAQLRWNSTSGLQLAAGSTTVSGSAIILIGHVQYLTANSQHVFGLNIPNGVSNSAGPIHGLQTVLAVNADLLVFVRGTAATAAGDLTFQSLIVEYVP